MRAAPVTDILAVRHIVLVVVSVSVAENVVTGPVRRDDVIQVAGHDRVRRGLVDDFLVGVHALHDQFKAEVLKLIQLRPLWRSLILTPHLTSQSNQ